MKKNEDIIGTLQSSETLLYIIYIYISYWDVDSSVEDIK